MPKSDRGGKRENSDEKLLNYYKSLNKLHKERLKKVSPEADVTRDFIQNAINYTQEQIDKLSNTMPKGMSTKNINNRFGRK